MTPEGSLLGRLCALLQSPDRELARAAARVIGALHLVEDEAVRALEGALKGGAREVRAAALDAITSIGGETGYELIEPLLADPGELGRKAAEAVAAMGAGVLPKLAARLEPAEETERRRILEIASRTGGAAATDLILRSLELGRTGPDSAGWLATGLLQADPSDRERLAARIDAFLKTKRARENPAAAEAAVGVLGRVAGPADQRRLLDLAMSPISAAARRSAIEALGRIAGSAPLDEPVVDALFSLLRDDDFTHIAAPSMAALEHAKLSASHAGALIGFLRGNDPALRRFAAAALGQVDGSRSAQALLAVLEGDNPELRQRAALSLARLRSAVGPVAEALAVAPDAPTAWILARILLPQDARLRPELAATLAKAGAAWLEAGDPRGEAVVALLRERHAEALRGASLQRVPRLKKSRRPAEILNLLRPSTRDGVPPPAELRYEIAIAEIAQGKKDVVREARVGHPGLAALEELARLPDFDLLGRLRREKSYLSPDDFYLVGCHFAERPHAERALGGELLRWLAKTYPGENAAQAATSKLLMEGFPPPAPPPKSRSGTAKPKLQVEARKSPPVRRK